MLSLSDSYANLLRRMRRGREGTDNSFGGFGDPFGGFPGFRASPFGGSLISSMFGGRDPFDDPFFDQPFRGMHGFNMFGPSMFGPHRSSFFGENSNADFLQIQTPLPPNRSKGPVIREISSDDEDEGDRHIEENDNNSVERRKKVRQHSGSRNEPIVLEADDEAEDKMSRLVEHRSERASAMRPQSKTFSYQSSTVTYGGVNGAYYTASKTRKMGGDGVVMEECKEADSTTGKATHVISRGIQDKGHTVARKLNPDGNVDTMQTLRNLNEDELSGFDQRWKGEARQHLPGYDESYEMLNNGFPECPKSSNSDHPFKSYGRFTKWIRLSLDNELRRWK